jgi:hypothetical protein
MRYQPTVFAQLMKALPRGAVERLAARHPSGRAKRILGAWGHVASMVVGQLAGTRSLRDLERLLERHSGVHAHLGLQAVRRSTLADANAGRPCALFEDIARQLSSKLDRRGIAGEAVRLIDATRIFAGRRCASWTASGALKLHIVYDPAGERPVCFAVTPERVNDIAFAKAMPVLAGATYVFDKGYYCFGWWAALAAQGCRFVTRLKTNSPVRLIAERQPEGEDILFDRVGQLSERLAGQRQNPFCRPLRLIGVRLHTGRELTLLSNDLEAPAADIAQLYRMRWQIELFFKWLKQNLKMAHFLGTSRNAVTIHILAALIAFLLLRLAQQHSPSTIGLQALARLMPATVLARRPLSDLLRPPDPPPQTGPSQPQLHFAYA